MYFIPLMLQNDRIYLWAPEMVQRWGVMLHVESSLQLANKVYVEIVIETAMLDMNKHALDSFLW